MRVWTFGGTAAVLGAVLTLACPVGAQASRANDTAKIKPSHPANHIATAHPASHVVASNEHHATVHVARIEKRSVNGRVGEGVHVALWTGAPHDLRHSGDPISHAVARRTIGRASYAHNYGGISCVPFARAATGISLKGNAANWWDAASGVYARGSRPEVGSVMNFRATGRMRLGHVAVVAAVVNSREVEIDHANWWGPGAGRGGVSRGVPVMDVSANNDWSEVRVGLGHSGNFGSVYPTYGFIYDRPDRGVMLANRPIQRAAVTDDEVAEAPGSGHPVYIDAANRSLR